MANNDNFKVMIKRKPYDVETRNEVYKETEDEPGKKKQSKKDINFTTLKGPQIKKNIDAIHDWVREHLESDCSLKPPLFFVQYNYKNHNCVEFVHYYNCSEHWMEKHGYHGNQDEYLKLEENENNENSD